MPEGYEVAAADEHIGTRFHWAYPGATVWLATRYVGETQPTNNVYIRPRVVEAVEP